MRAAARTPFPFLLVAFALLAGCLAGPDLPAPTDSFEGALRVVDAGGLPVPYAQASVVRAGQVVSVTSADAQGVFAALPQIPADGEISVGAPGFAELHFASDAVPGVVMLSGSGAATAGPFLRWLPAVDLVCPMVDPPPYSCDRFGEPVLEIAGDGTIWASATSAVGRSPPIWTSRDAGQTFQLLEGEGAGLVRDAVGIEGDFAIDEAGNVYFFDILAGAAYFTSYEADGTHRWTVPQAWEPLVDRPWVRAGKADEVWVLYNTGTASNLLKSEDGGRTFDLLDATAFPCSLGAFAQHPVERERLYVAAACGGEPKLWTTTDGGATWDKGEALPLPEHGSGPRRIDTFVVPAVDDAGNAYVTFTHALPPPAGVADDDWNQTAVFVARRDAGGAWSPARQVSPAGVAHMPWPAAGAAGRLGIAWYQSPGDVEGPSSEWRLLTAVSIDADGVDPHFQLAVADPETLATGPLGRQLGDFLEARLSPDGRLAVVYGKQVGRTDVVGAASGLDDQVRFVQSHPTLGLAPSVFLNGPPVP